jgi:hypothetical protein
MNDRSRRALGAIFGLVLGLTYGLVSQTINQIALPGLPFYQEGPGTVASIVLITLGGAVMGLLAAWPDETIPGVILSAVGAAILSTLATFLMIRSSPASEERIAGALALLVITFPPRALIFAPIAWSIRKVLGVWEDEVRRETLSLPKIALSAAALPVLGILLGALALHPQDARYALKTTNELIQSGMLATSRDQLPPALVPVDGFLQGARGPYTLLLSDDPDSLPVQRPMSSYLVQEYAVFVNFANGFRFGCAFTPPHPQPACGDY